MKKQIVMLLLLSMHEYSRSNVWHEGQAQVCQDMVELETWQMGAEKSGHRSVGVLGHNISAFTDADALGVPPDVEGSVGPTQFIGIINGWIRSFNKRTGKADNMLNIALPQFFAPIAKDQDPFDVRIRFDRGSGRWFMLCINRGGPNQMYIAVSDGGTITQYSKWRYFKFTIGSPGIFADYPTFGIDVNALYVGTPLYTEPGGESQGARVFVLPKAPFVSAGTPVMFTFNNLVDGMGNGGIVNQGVNNFDPSATMGYFISDNQNGDGLVLYRVSNPGTMPTISSPIVISAGVPLRSEPIKIQTKNGMVIDGGDSRLMGAHIRNNRLWTVQGVGSNNTGDSSNPGAVTRNACRWYELDIVPATPVVVQTGILFDATMMNTFVARSYIYPTLMTSGQGAMAMVCSTAGPNEFINSAVACRLATDAAGTLRTPTLYTSSSTSYFNPDADRWGDYSYVSVDPCDDMTMWAISEYCFAQNRWACRAVQILAPAPATPTSATSVGSGQVSVNTTITGTSVSGTGFYDPGVGFACRISASVTGGVIVNSITYVSPTQVILNLNTTGAMPGSYNVTITNPDGQSAVGVGILTVT